MKKFSATVLILLVCGFSALYAQTYQSLRDTVWCCRHFQRLDGDYFSVGDRNGYSGFMPPANDRVITCIYAHIPKGHCRADLFLAPKYGKVGKVDIKVINPNTNDTLWSNVISASYQFGGETCVEAFPDIDFPQDCFYRIELNVPKPTTNIGSISRLLFQHEAVERVVTPSIFMAPSTHLYSWDTTDPDAPGGESYDWMYGEVLFPSQYHRINSYVMTLGMLAGYSGISTVGGEKRHGMLFSQWDNGDTEVDKYLPSYLRSSGLDCGPDWKMQGFGGEGTGVQTVTIGDSPWRNDEWVQFVANCRPEDVEFWVEDEFGNPSAKMVSHNTLVSLWWKQPADKEWKYVSTLRAAGRNMYFSGWYSFVENYTDNGGDLYRRAYFRNGFMRSVSSGRWYNRNVCGFGHTDGGNSRTSRHDYGHGRTSLYDNCFYLSTGGFKAAPDDSSGYVTLTDNHTCVDTINLEALIRRFDAAVIKGKMAETEINIESARAHLPQSSWSVIGFSDQEETGEGHNGFAADMSDGSEDTYWHSRYQSGTKLKQHYIDFKAIAPTEISNVLLVQKRNTDYRAKAIEIYTSADGQQWNLHQDGLSVADAERAEVQFNPVTTQYVRIKFLEGFGTNLVINELYWRADYSLEKVQMLVERLLNDAGDLRSYRSADLEALAAVYDGGKCTDIDALLAALRDVAATKSPMQFSTVADLSHTGTKRSYILQSTAQQGTLCVDMSGTAPRLTLKNATAVDALPQNKERMTAENMLSNWSFVRNDHYGSLYVYNLGAKMYLDPSNAPTYLSKEPVSMPYISLGNYSLTMGASGRQILTPKADQEEPITFGVRTAACTFNLIDNQLFTPSEEWADSLLAQTEIYDKFEAYKRQIPALLSMPDGLVGSITNEAQKAELQQLYDGGNVSRSQAAELVDMVENLERIEFEPAQHLYRIAVGNANADKPAYLTMEGDGIYTRAANNKADQMWYLKPLTDGHGLLSQGLAISHMADKAGSIVTKSEATRPANFQLSTDSLVTYYIENVRHSHYYLGNDNSPVKVTRGESVAKWYLEPCDELSVSMNSGGVTSAYYDFDIMLPDGLEAYTVEGIEGADVKLWRIDSIVPARTPIVLRGDAYATYRLRALAQQSAAYESPLMQGTLLKKSGLTPKSVYTVTVKSGKPCLSQYVGTTVNANQCYVAKEIIDDLNLSGSTFSFDFEGAITGISTAAPAGISHTAPAYDLQGHKVNHKQKGGIYVIDGKTVKY